MNTTAPLIEPYGRFGKDEANPHHFSREFQEVLDLFKSLMGRALKAEKLLEEGVITGILRIAKANFFSELNNFTEYSVLDEGFTPYYGFTQDAVDMLFQQQGITLEQQMEIKKWYKGYNYSRRAAHQKVTTAREGIALHQKAVALEHEIAYINK